jgi:hypothetical protein
MPIKWLANPKKRVHLPLVIELRTGKTPDEWLLPLFILHNKSQPQRTYCQICIPFERYHPLKGWDSGAFDADNPRYPASFFCLEEVAQMSAKRLSMRKTKEVLRLHWANGLSKRQTAKSCCAHRK